MLSLNDGLGICYQSWTNTNSTYNPLFGSSIPLATAKLAFGYSVFFL